MTKMIHLKLRYIILLLSFKDNQKMKNPQLLSILSENLFISQNISLKFTLNFIKKLIKRLCSVIKKIQSNPTQFSTLHRSLILDQKIVVHAKTITNQINY